MGDLRSKLRAKFPRRHSGIPSLPSEKSTNSNRSVESDSAVNGLKHGEPATAGPEDQDASHTRPATSASEGDTKLIDKLRQGAKHLSARGIAVVSDAFPSAAPESVANNEARSPAGNATNPVHPEAPGSGDPHGLNGMGNDRHFSAASKLSSVTESSPDSNILPPTALAPADASKSRVSTEAARKVRLSDPPVSSDPATSLVPDPVGPPSNPPLRPSNSVSRDSRPPAPTRRQSLLPSRQTTLIRTLLSPSHSDELDSAAPDQLLPISANMITRKLWVKRAGGSATIVTINEEDLVDDVRELILRKYANSLGRQFDAPDLTLRIVPREQQRQERVLGPEEPMARTLDAYFPGGQTVDEALVIDIPHRRTPRASPRNGPPHAQHLTSASYEDIRPLEASTDYFGPGAVAHIPVGAANGTTHSISVLNTGQVPQIPSPGSGGRTRQYRERPDRPRLGRQHTSSPTILNVVGAGGHTATIAVAANHGMQYAHPDHRSRTHSNASSDPPSAGQAVPPAPPMPTPPAQEVPATAPAPKAGTPPARAASPRPPPAARPKKKKPSADAPALPSGMLSGTVPPINVLIVEDNIINLRLLEAFVKRLKVRWQTAMNGREAVTKWRTGGFHLVLMDIQLPVMSGLEATREIRRLERMNSIGAFSTNSNNNNNKGETEDANGETAEEDKLANRELFKSPVIIVALTASSLQSDRHEALAAGCNDFLTKVCLTDPFP